jgi:copper homeostasis protein (lipoprotein)
MAMTTRLLPATTLSLALLLAAGCAGTGAVVPGDAPPALGPLPATYAGKLPCADCPGILYHLNLFPDNVFTMRMTYLERPEAGDLDDIGSWALSSDGRTLILQGGQEAPDLFAIKGPRTLRKLDLEGREIDSALPYELVRADTLAVFEPHLALRGMYSYLADAGLFTECLTGRRFPVATEGDNAALEQAYAQARREPGAPLLVNLEGRLAERPQIDGAGTATTLVVDRFLRVWPDDACPPRFTPAALAGTTWLLTSLGGQPVVVTDPQRQPSLVLDEAANRLTGSGGCNRIMGGYQLDGDQIRFLQVASTRMACPDGLDTEVAFTKALAQVVSWRILGRRLEFYDASGIPLACFQEGRP